MDGTPTGTEPDPGDPASIVVTTEGAGTHYRGDIDGLRALAVALVVLFHAAPSYLPGGFVGVAYSS